MFKDKRGIYREADIAIVVPVYNAEKYLKACIRSILKSTFENFKVVLVDDGSTDSSGEICDYFAEKDSRVYVIHQENSGSVKAREVGLTCEEVKNVNYICFCDADDRIAPQMLEKMYREVREKGADYVCVEMNCMWKGMPMPRQYKRPCFKNPTVQSYSHREIMSQLYISCFGITDFPVALAGKLIQKELLVNAIQKKPLVKFMGDDLSVTLKIMPEAKRLVIIPEKMYYYRMGGGRQSLCPSC